MVTVTSPWRDGWRLAVGTLTVLPVRPPEQVDARVARAMATLAPLAFMPVALIAGGLGFATVALGWPSLVAGLLTVAATAWLTRAIHLDGLADTVDGLGSGRPTEAALAIMRRGDVGPMGVVALVVVLALQAIAAAELLGREGGWLGLVVALCAGRAALARRAGCGVRVVRATLVGDHDLAGVVRRAGRGRGMGGFELVAGGCGRSGGGSGGAGPGAYGRAKVGRHHRRCAGCRRRTGHHRPARDAGPLIQCHLARGACCCAAPQDAGRGFALGGRTTRADFRRAAVASGARR